MIKKNELTKIKKLYIAGKPYDIIWLGWGTKEGHSILGDYMGKSSSGDQQIFVSGSHKKEITAEVLLHEIIHIIVSDHMIDLNEAQVQQMACGLMELFLRNPKLVKTIYTIALERK